MVPSIVDDGIVITESNDIMFYLNEKFPGPNLMPTDEEGISTVKKWVNLASEEHLRTVKTYVYGTTGMKSKKANSMSWYRKMQQDKELLKFHEKSFAGFADSEV